MFCKYKHETEPIAINKDAKPSSLAPTAAGLDVALSRSLSSPGHLHSLKEASTAVEEEEEVKSKIQGLPIHQDEESSLADELLFEDETVS